MSLDVLHYKATFLYKDKNILNMLQQNHFVIAKFKKFRILK